MNDNEERANSIISELENMPEEVPLLTQLDEAVGMHGSAIDTLNKMIIKKYAQYLNQLKEDKNNLLLEYDRVENIERRQEIKKEIDEIDERIKTQQEKVETFINKCIEKLDK